MVDSDRAMKERANGYEGEHGGGAAHAQTFDAESFIISTSGQVSVETSNILSSISRLKNIVLSWSILSEIYFVKTPVPGPYSTRV